MKDRANQNSILFLTTLGVYLGLVFAGATPQGFANAATARSFDISDEIDVHDNLDRDPADSLVSARSTDSSANPTKAGFAPLTNFLDPFSSLLPVSALPLAEGIQRSEVAIRRSEFSVYDDRVARSAAPRFCGLSVNHLARSSIDASLAKDVS